MGGTDEKQTRAGRRARALMLGLGVSGALLHALLGANAARSQGPLARFLGFPIGGGPVEVGEVPVGITSIEAEACGVCHAEHYAEWANSTHRTAYTNPVFQAEFGRRRRDFCVNCHAPRLAIGETGFQDGIDCATCHVRDGAILNPVVSGDAPHESRAEPILATVDACARCHEFDFEGQRNELLQSTLSEWAASPAGREGRTCQGCHMDRADGDERRHRHDWPASRNHGMLERSIQVEGELGELAGERRRVTLRLRVADAGHAVPTGDMFRRLEVRIWPGDAVEAAETEWLRRRFRVDRRGGWHESSDTRVPEHGERIVRATLPGAPHYGWDVHLWLLPRSEAEAAGIPIEEVRTLVTSGTLSVDPSVDSNPSPTVPDRGPAE